MLNADHRLVTKGEIKVAQKFLTALTVGAPRRSKGIDHSQPRNAAFYFEIFINLGRVAYVIV